jgi:hypothetical protein
MFFLSDFFPRKEEFTTNNMFSKNNVAFWGFLG